jgi:hypothetical protein
VSPTEIVCRLRDRHAVRAFEHEPLPAGPPRLAPGTLTAAEIIARRRQPPAARAA